MLDHVEEGLVRIGDDQCGVADRRADEFLGALPLDLSQMSVDHDDLVGGDALADLEVGGLAVLAAAAVDDEESAAAD